MLKSHLAEHLAGEMKVGGGGEIDQADLGEYESLFLWEASTAQAAAFGASSLPGFVPIFVYAVDLVDFGRAVGNPRNAATLAVVDRSRLETRGIERAPLRDDDGNLIAEFDFFFGPVLNLIRKLVRCSIVFADIFGGRQHEIRPLGVPEGPLEVVIEHDPV